MVRHDNSFEIISSATDPKTTMQRLRIEDLPMLMQRVFDDETRNALGLHRDIAPVVQRALMQMNGHDRFYNKHTRARIASMLREPRLDLMQNVEQYAGKVEDLMPKQEAPRRKIRRGQEYGDSVDIDREISGVLECWDRSERVRTNQRTVTLAINLAMSCSTVERDLVAKGGLAAAMVEQLTKRGVNVELVAANDLMHCTSNRHKHFLTEIIVKKATDVPDVATLATMCCDPGFIRAVMYCGSFTFLDCGVNENWGWPVTLREVQRQFPQVEYDYVIDNTVCTPADAARTIERLVEKSRGG